MEKEILNSYATDLYALIKHTVTVVRTQKNSEKVTNKQLIDHLHNIDLALSGQLNEFQDLDETLKEGAEKTVKEKVAAAAGKVAGYIDSARNDAASKLLRDDYTALGMIASGYTMLHTASLGTDHEELQNFTRESLTRVAQLITETSKILPHIVAEELDISEVAEEAENNTQEAWKPENFLV